MYDGNGKMLYKLCFDCNKDKMQKLFFRKTEENENSSNYNTIQKKTKGKKIIKSNVFVKKILNNKLIKCG